MRIRVAERQNAINNSWTKKRTKYAYTHIHILIRIHSTTHTAANEKSEKEWVSVQRKTPSLRFLFNLL